MKSTHKAVIVVVLVIVGFLGVIYAQDNFYQKKLNYDNALETADLHIVNCIDEDGQFQTYHIPIPNDVVDLDSYARGFCNSIYPIN